MNQLLAQVSIAMPGDVAAGEFISALAMLKSVFEIYLMGLIPNLAYSGL